ncbi:hypothetical protein F4859DRAFT_526104 [Xylaria cf. heliscus]|nr:hypothetical protein F4859DRAFT_526104 [Xylaria cf. heliscus]
MAGMGKVNTAAVAANCRVSSPTVKLTLVVGIYGVVPFTPSNEKIMLGDVIVSDGVIQYDLGRRLSGGFGLSWHKKLQNKMADYLDKLRGNPELAAKYPGTAHIHRFVRPVPVNAESPTLERLEGSSLLMIKGTLRSRFAVKDFCVNAIEVIRESRVPVLWALKMIAPGGGMAHVSGVEILKLLVLQLPVAYWTESPMAKISARIGRAGTENDWLGLLGSVLMPTREIVVIIVDFKLLIPAMGVAAGAIPIPMAFLTLFRKLTEHNANTIVKVILVSYGSSNFSIPTEPGNEDLVLAVARAGKYITVADKNFRGASNRGVISVGVAVKTSLRQTMAKRR